MRKLYWFILAVVGITVAVVVGFVEPVHTMVIEGVAGATGVTGQAIRDAYWGVVLSDWYLNYHIVGWLVLCVISAFILPILWTKAKAKIKGTEKAPTEVITKPVTVIREYEPEPVKQTSTKAASQENPERVAVETQPETTE